MAYWVTKQIPHQISILKQTRFSIAILSLFYRYFQYKYSDIVHYLILPDQTFKTQTFRSTYAGLYQPHSLWIPLVRRKLYSDIFFPRIVIIGWCNGQAIGMIIRIPFEFDKVTYMKMLLERYEFISTPSAMDVRCLSGKVIKKNILIIKYMIWLCLFV